MASRPDETRKVTVAPGANQGPAFTIERWGGRFLVYGPHARMLFTSYAADSWTTAIAEARKLWARMDRVRRDKWHGPDGKYAKMQREA